MDVIKFMQNITVNALIKRCALLIARSSGVDRPFQWRTVNKILKLVGWAEWSKYLYSLLRVEDLIPGHVCLWK